METSFIEIDNIKIAYIEKNPDAATTIFFIHGNSVSKTCWRKQCGSELLSSYRLIALDLPGHGDSQPALNKNVGYTLKGLASIMRKAVGKLIDDRPYILAGLSVGTNIIAEMLPFNITPDGLILAGPSLVNKKYSPQTFIKPNTHVGVVFTDKADENDVILYCKETSMSEEKEDLDIFVSNYKATDKTFRGIFATSIADENYSDELALIQRSDIPCLVIFGKDELVVDPGYLDSADLPLWRNKIFKISGASHLVNIDQPDTFNALVLEFAQDVLK
jgi:pimeloyl-ACP methyl ester carboxylesterase